MTAKTAIRTAKPSPRNGNRLPLGAHPGNTGGKKGRSGPRPLAITLAAQRAVTEYDLLGEAVKIATTAPRESDRLAAIRLLLDRGYGQVPQRLEHTGEDGGPIAIVQDARRTFESRMDRLTERLGAAAMPEWPER